MCAQSVLESQVFDERDKAQRLQTELDVSEQVQKDFVKLSQTLQVRNFLDVWMMKYQYKGQCMDDIRR